MLKKLPVRPDGRYDGSPAALETLPAEQRQSAFTPTPAIITSSEILFDAWALTSIRQRMPGRPPVADWLHGIAEWEAPQTYVAWRREVEIINTLQLRDEYHPEDLLDDYPLKPHELLRDATHRVSRHLKQMAERFPDGPVWVLDPDGNVEVSELAQVASHDLGNCTVLLPPKAGGLSQGGILDGSEGVREDQNYDIADEWRDEENRPRRCRVWDTEKVPEGMRQVRVIDTWSMDEDVADEEQYTQAGHLWRWYVRPRSADDDGSTVSRLPQDLCDHMVNIERIAQDLTGKLALTGPAASAVAYAARWHDLGKRRELWQRSIGNHEYPARVLAKSGQMSTHFRSHYRHELGSLIDVSQDAEFLSLDAEVQDLVLHLIAAHHGRARPHFDPGEIFDPERGSNKAEEIAREAPRRFARLQRKYGRWGLAYLESLVRAADAVASREPKAGYND